MNYFQPYALPLDENIVAAWDSQVAEAADSPWLAQALATRGANLFPRFAARYAELRALPRGARRALQRQLTRSSGLAIPSEWQRKLAGTLAGAALLLALGHGTAQSGTITVTTTKPAINSGDTLCSLIEAIVNANAGGLTHPDCPNAAPGANTIQLPANKTNTLTASFNTYYGSATGLPLITSPITIEGPGTIARKTTGPQFRLLAVGSGGDLTLKNVTLKGGRTTTSGGAVYNSGNLTVDHSTISGNRANSGGGIFNDDDATATITYGTITRNRADYAGGGIYNDPNASVTIQNSTVSRNQTPNYGGGIINYNGTLTITNSTISGNSADYGGGVHNGGVLSVAGSTLSGNRAFSGGAIWNDDYHTATVTNSTISGNRASYGGGGIAIDVFSSVTVQNSTISGNKARLGGGISNYATVTIDTSTISGNSAKVAGGGIFNDYSFYNGTPYIGTATVTNSTISGNKARYGAGIFNDIHTTVTVDNSTISGNRKARVGGGILNAFDALLTVTNSTVSGNTASLAGGGIFNHYYFFNGIPYSATATISNSTITGNKARGGGGILNIGILDLNRSLISGNLGTFGREVFHYAYVTNSVTAANYNLFGVSNNAGTYGFVPSGSDIVPAVPLASIIDPLANNGGPTYTHALPLGSPAIDAAPLAGCPATDQRGTSRPQGPLCDIGAYEK